MSPAELHALAADEEGHDARPAPAHWGVTRSDGDEADESLTTAHRPRLAPVQREQRATRIRRLYSGT